MPSFFLLFFDLLVIEFASPLLGSNVPFQIGSALLGVEGDRGVLLFVSRLLLLAQSLCHQLCSYNYNAIPLIQTMRIPSKTSLQSIF
jgi:hypothetical protein